MTSRKTAGAARKATATTTKTRRRKAAPPLPSVVGMVHGGADLPAVSVASYNLEVRDGDGFLGDRASQTAFRVMLDQWRRRHRERGARDPFGRAPSADLRKKAIDAALRGEKSAQAADIVNGAIEEFAQSLAFVIRRFLRQKSWRGVRRIVIGGGFPESEVGEHAVLQASAILQEHDCPVALARLRHLADDGGLLGWLQLTPPHLLSQADAILAIDLGGTNARCGIVKANLDKAADFSRAKVVRRSKWRHADDQPNRTALVERLAAMLQEMIDWADRRKLKLAPFVGIACPGLIREDGSIARGTQNLPGDWQSPHFHLPTVLREHIPLIRGDATQVLMHNDAVVQGLSELPFMREVKHWAVLTVGTGLGNASYVNRPVPAPTPPPAARRAPRPRAEKRS